MKTASGFDPGYFAQLAKIENDNFWFRARNKTILGALKCHFPHMKDFFEIGCGTGFVLSAVKTEFPETALSGSDYFAEGLAFAKTRVGTADLRQMDAREIPFQSAFDVVGAFDVLEHIEEDTDVLAGMYRAVRPGGGLVITVPQHPGLWSQFDDYSHHVRRYTARDLRKKAEAAGFQIIDTHSFVSLLLPFLLASRLKKKTAHYDGMQELRLWRPLDLSLECVLDAERVLIRAGIRFPAGGSLLLVARKPL